MSVLRRRNKKSNIEVAQDYINLDKDQNHFELVKIDQTIGFGVFTKRQIEKGEFILEYRGELISEDEAEKRREQYATENLGSFIFYGIKNIHGKSVCIDATNDTKSLGRMVNDSPKFLSNALMKRIICNEEVHLCLFASSSIKAGTEIRYDYGEKKEDMPWRSLLCYHHPQDMFSIKALSNIIALSDEPDLEIPFVPQFKKFPINDSFCSTDLNERCSTSSPIPEREHEILLDVFQLGISENPLGLDMNTQVNQSDVEVPYIPHFEISSNDVICCSRNDFPETSLSTPQKENEPLEVIVAEDNLEVIVAEDDLEVIVAEDDLEVIVAEDDLEVIVAEDNLEVIVAEDNLEVIVAEGNLSMDTPINDSGLMVDRSLEIINTDEDDNGASSDISTLDKETNEPKMDVVTGPKKDNLSMDSPINDSGLIVDRSLEIINTDEDDNGASSNIYTLDKETNDPKIVVVTGSKKRYTKPSRPCIFCQLPQSRLKRHIMTKHKHEPKVKELLTMNSKEQDRCIASFRKLAIKNHNLETLKEGKQTVMRERKVAENKPELPLMCSGCFGFFSKQYKARHQLVCPAVSSHNLMVPMVDVSCIPHLESYPDDFKDLLNTIQLDDVGNYIKIDHTILMIGARSFAALKRKKDKTTETKKLVRSRMRLTARIYLSFRELYKKQTEVTLDEMSNDASDMYRREAIVILGQAVNQLAGYTDDESAKQSTSVSGQKSGLKVSILNLMKLTSKFLIGNFLVQNSDKKAQRVTDFLQVLKLYENEIFGDAYYDIQHRRNSNLRKPVNLPKDSDVNLLLDECRKIMTSINDFEHPVHSFVNIRSATATTLIIFCARRGGEPVRLQTYQWEEAVNGDWIDKRDIPEEFDMNSMLLTFQTGKGGDHLVPVIFLPETIKAMQFLTNAKVRQEAGVHVSNPYVFASTQNSQSHASGWHCINDILKRLDLKGVINATKNRHRVASLLARLNLPESERQLIYKHFGHSERINATIYQSLAGSMHLETTAKRLIEINSLPKQQKNLPSSSKSSCTITKAADDVPQLRGM